MASAGNGDFAQCFCFVEAAKMDTLKKKAKKRRFGGGPRISLEEHQKWEKYQLRIGAKDGTPFSTVTLIKRVLQANLDLSHAGLFRIKAGLKLIQEAEAAHGRNGQ